MEFLCACLRGAASSKGSAKVAPDFSGLGGPPASSSSGAALGAGAPLAHKAQRTPATPRTSAVPPAFSSADGAAPEYGSDPSQRGGTLSGLQRLPSYSSTDTVSRSFEDVAASQVSGSLGPPPSPAATRLPQAARAEASTTAVAKPTLLTADPASAAGAAAAATAAEAKKHGVREGHFGVELTRSSAQVHWGFIWHPKTMEQRHERVLEKLRPNSPADEWNRLHPDQGIRVGDTLVKVNGKGGRLELLTVELGKTHIFCEFKPSEPRQSLGHPSSSSSASAVSLQGTSTSKTTRPASKEGPYPKVIPINDVREDGRAGVSPGLHRVTYKVELSRKTSSQRWGFVWDDKVMERCEARVVSKITPGSLVSEWNVAHPTRQVQVGDTLVGVNGVVGRMELLTVELSKMRIECELRSGDTRCGSESVASKTAAVAASGPGSDRIRGPSTSLARSPAQGGSGSSSSDQPAPLAQATPSVQQGPVAAPPGPLKEGHYRVELRRSSKATRWGFVWDADAMEKQKSRVLSKVSPGTPAADWNTAHPGQEMQPGDTLVLINGRGGRLEFLSIELNKDHIVCEFQSAKPQAARTGSALIANLRAARPGSMPLGLSSDAAGAGCDFAGAAGRAAGSASSSRNGLLPAITATAHGPALAPGPTVPPPAPQGLPPVKGVPGAGKLQVVRPAQSSNSKDPSALAASAAAAAASAAAVAASAAAAAASAVAAYAGPVEGPGDVASAGDAAEDTDIDRDGFGADGSSAGDVYVVELRRSAPSQRWGFVWDPDILAKQKARTVTKLTPGTPVAEWNVANPGQEVRPGDTLLKVNGRAGRMEIHTLELNKNVITCEFRSATTRQALRHSSGVLPFPAASGAAHPHQTQPIGMGTRPAWWEQWPAGGGQAQSVAPAEVREAVQHIMDLGQATCQSQLHSGRHFEVVNVLHNQHAGLWEKYCAAHSKLRRNGGMVVAASPPLGPPVPPCMGTLDPDAGECLLFHGTKPNSVERVCLGLFDNSGVDPGPTGGVYLYEASGSADLCAQDNLEGMYAGLCAMLLCRAACGTSLSLDGLGPEEMSNSLCDAALAASYDSAISGDAAVGCRLILVRDKDLVYPEYVVLYRRMRALEAESV